jgi:MerR family redox-sensitive transcriptional activator SoxR
VAERAGVRPSSIRYYESIGLLPEPERSSGQRRYTSDVVARLAAIAVAQQAGFSLQEIAALLDESQRSRPSERLQMLARRKLDEVDALIARAEAMRGWLEAASRCECPSFDDCALFEAPAGPRAD